MTVTTQAMHITHGSQMSFEDAGSKHRTGGISFKYLSTGIEGTPDNYMFILAQQKDFYSPRHHHNFDQFRYAVSGDFSLAPDITLKEGDIAYHPEGVYYGPQNDGPEERTLLVLQFAGASGAGFMSLDQIRAANKELGESGKFEGGNYYAHESEGQGVEPVDGYEVAWEHVAKKKIEYPQGRYERPIVMSPSNFHWRRVGTNISRKLLGVFSEKETLAQMWRIDGSGSFEVGGDGAIHLLYIVQGDGMVKEEKVLKESCVRLWAGQKCIISSVELLEVLHFVMPMAT